MNKPASIVEDALRPGSSATAPARVRPEARSDCLDDAGRLRRCRACDCPDLDARRRGTQLVRAAAAGAAVLAAAAGGLLTLGQAGAAVALIVAALLAALRLRGPMPGRSGLILCCDRCDARHGGVEAAPRQRRWAAETAAAWLAAPPVPAAAALGFVVDGPGPVRRPCRPTDRPAAAAADAAVRGFAATTPVRSAA